MYKDTDLNHTVSKFNTTNTYITPNPIIISFVNTHGTLVFNDYIP